MPFSFRNGYNKIPQKNPLVKNGEYSKVALDESQQAETKPEFVASPDAALAVFKKSAPKQKLNDAQFKRSFELNMLDEAFLQWAQSKPAYARSAMTFFREHLPQEQLIIRSMLEQTFTAPTVAEVARSTLPSPKAGR